MAGAVGLQTGQRVAGVVENMSWLRLPDWFSTTRLFGSGGGRTVADSLSLALGTEVPRGSRRRWTRSWVRPATPVVRWC